MIELTITLAAPACTGGGTGAQICTAKRTLAMSKTLNTPEDLARLLAAFESAMERTSEDMLAELLEEFQKAAQTPVPDKPAKKGKADGPA